MPGGSRDGYEAIKSIVEKVAAQVDDGPCVTYIGPGGAGTLIKQYPAPPFCSFVMFWFKYPLPWEPGHWRLTAICAS